MENIAADHIAEPAKMQTFLSVLEDEYSLLPVQADIPKEFSPYILRDEPAIAALPGDPLESQWETMYLKFKSNVKNGHVFSSSESDQLTLTDWLNRQIINRRHLSDTQFRKLDSLGVHWDIPISRDHAWETMFMRIQIFKNEFGHCRVPSQWGRDKQLALWVMRQRKMNTKGKILEYRRRLLCEIGFTWEVKEQYNSQWEECFRLLEIFHRQHGHCIVPGKEKKLVSWMERQRLAYKKSVLSPERKKRLDGTNFIWDFNDIKKKSWEEKYEQLRKFHAKYGHSFVPVNYKNDKPLGTWVASQRRSEATGTLSKAKREKLNKLNFVWSRDTLTVLRSEYDSLWEQNFGKLKVYKRAHGTCQVSLKLDPVLQSWTVWQRRMYYAGKLPADRIKRLDDICFPWSINEGYWQKMFKLLCEFHEKFGHCRVPSQWSANPGLAAWTYRIRADKYKLSEYQLELLNTLGFEWSIKKKILVEWSHMYSRLLAFQEEHSHTRVPVKWHRDQKLGKWVSRMRNERFKLSADRLKLLEAVDFF